MPQSSYEYKKSGLTYLSGAFSTVILFATTVIVFSAINMAVFKIDSGVFEFKRVTTPFTFFHYSFETMFFASIRDLAPVDTISYIANMMQKMFSILLIPIFIDEYKVSTIEDALAEIKRLESRLVHILLFLTERLKY